MTNPSHKYTLSDMNLSHSYQRYQVLKESSIVNTDILMTFRSSSTSIPQGKHVMFSHDVSDENIVLQILQALCDQSIPVWFDRDRGWSHNIYDRYVYSNYHHETDRINTICISMFQSGSRNRKCSIRLLFCESKVRKISSLSNRTTVCEKVS